VLLQTRPAPGIWGGLLCPPQVDDMAAARRLAQALGARWETRRALPAVEHGFTHFELSITPLRMAAGAPAARLAEPEAQWLPLSQAVHAALPAPVKRLLQAVAADEGGAS
jgi:A/G-specific adenine glycosylase